MARIQLAFKVSAPGKVILHGEHSVVYGKPAVAGAVGARNSLIFREQSHDSIDLDYTSISVQHKFAVLEVNKVLEQFSGNENNLDSSDKIESFFKCLIPDNLTDQGRKGLTSTLYLLCGILSQNKIKSISTGFSIKITSELSVGAGLGSSASFGVCLSAAFITYSKCRSVGDLSLDLSPEDKNTISNWAFESEKIMHGTPSGVDNTVCTFGSIVKFTKLKPIEHVDIKRKINILLVDSKVSRSTIKLVKQVAELKQEFPSIVDHMLSAMEEVANHAADLYASDSVDSNCSFEKLKKLFQINNDLLKGIGVSHPKLENIFSIALANGYSSKITGAGGGGYALILLPDSYKEMESFKTLCSDLENAGFSYLETNVGGPGVVVERV
ncbi:unnamed protein product [Hermetia illucens]|uniref:Mevalonate kinase n=1 Tax=Hermetia illucens TaxID=343691 RepID=A0A7R8YNL0_HERIL|nr:mevalonate kinase [Hermetia illucens]CAD7079746.1 unnamed protein product [Hermetia illucens]